MLRYAAALLSIFEVASALLNNNKFPENFIFGVGTSSYQIEGAWNEGGKGQNIWDFYLHNNPDLVEDKTNGDIACDSYHKWREDVQLVKNLGVDLYRFSISWGRILPLGYKNTEINKEGVRFYSDLIDTLLAEGITPYVTIYHWDLPQTLQNKGGWLNETIIDDYLYYAKTLFELYGDRVKHWTTFNEFSRFCENSYSDAGGAPFWNLPGVGGYECAHNALLSHGAAYRLYEKEFAPTQKGQVGVTVDSGWCEPLTESQADLEAVERFMQFNYGWYVHPLFIGNYPPIMIERIDTLSKQQGYKKSRLPKFTSEQINLLKGSLDFLGLNHYSSSVCTFRNDFPQPSLKSDCGVGSSKRPTWKSSAASWLKYYPVGIKKLLIWIKEHYNNPPVLITENGWPTAGLDLDDDDRIEYHRGYLSSVLDAIYEENCNVFGYTIWSLMDVLEWTSGYTFGFGLIQVDFGSPNRTRTPRASYHVYKDIVERKKLV